MKNKQLWKPTKFIKRKNNFIVTKNSKDLGIGSRFIAGIQCKVYEKMIKENAFGLLLDLGCGNVPLYEMYKDYVADNICVDWIDTFHKNQHLDYVFNLNQGIPLDTKFDSILMTDTLEHIANPDQLFFDISRLLKPSGKLILTVPFLYWIHEEPYDYYRFTKYKLKMLCEQNKLKVISIYPYGGSLEIILDIVAKHIASFKILSAIHLFFSNILVNSFVGKILRFRTSEKFPLGYCLVALK